MGVRVKPIKKAARFAWAAFLLFPGVLFSIRHYPDQANHKRFLLRKKEDNNQASNKFEQMHQVHFGLPFMQSTAKSGNKKAARLGGFRFPAGVVISLSP